MTENKLKEIDESAIFRLLWSKKIPIILLTALSTIIGICYTYFRPETYIVKTELKSDKNIPSLTRDSLYLSKFKDIKTDYSNKCITIFGKTSDTSKLAKQTKIIADRLEESISSYYQLQIDSLQLTQQKIKIEINSKIQELTKIKSDKNLYVKYELESLIRRSFDKLEFLSKQEDALYKTKIKISTPKIKMDNNKLDKKSLLLHWIFFGFVGSCIIVLGYIYLLALLKKQRD